MIKYGVLSTLRSPMKTISFFIIITAVTIALSIGMGMWHSTENLLAEADATFTTAGEFTYNEAQDLPHYDDILADVAEKYDSSLFNRDEVLFFEENIIQRGYISGYRHKHHNAPLREFAVVTLATQQYDDKIGGYGAIIYDDIYSGYDMENNFIYLLCEQNDQRFEAGSRYAIIGTVKELTSSTVNGFEPIVSTGIDTGDYTYKFPAVMNITNFRNTQDFLDSPNGDMYKEAGEVLRILNESIDVVATKDINVVEGFHSGKYTLIDGELFDNTKEESCVVPKTVAAQMGLSLGDSIDLSLHYPTEYTSRFFSYHPDVGFSIKNIEYTIVGIYQADDVNLPVFVPYTGQDYFGRSKTDPVLARVSIDNRRADEYLESVKQILPDEVSFSLYDQGYKAAIIPINTIRSTALLIIAMCVVVCVLVLWLFGLLFIRRSEHDGKIMLILGAGKARVIIYYMTLGGIITGLAALTGVIAGYFISKSIFEKVYKSTVENTVYDFRYSIIGYGIRNETFAPKPEINPWIYLFLAIAVVITALLFCLGFAVNVIIKQNPKYTYRKNKKPVKPGLAKESHAIGSRLNLPSVALRYAVKSALRGSTHSIAIPLLFVVMLSFICIYHDAILGFREKLDTVYDDIPVVMRFCDISGKRIDNLILTSYPVDAIADTDYIDKAWGSSNLSFMFLGVSQYADGTTSDVETFEPPSTIEGRVAFVDGWNWVSEENVHLRIGNGISTFENAPEFAHTVTPEIVWAAGYNEERFFNSSDTDENFNTIIASSLFLKKYNVSLGDVISVVYLTSSENFMYGSGYYQSNLTIAGSFSGTSPNIYTYYSGDTWADRYNWISMNERVLVHRRYNSAGFLLNNTAQLSSFKDTLGEHIDLLGQAGKNRVWAIIDDESLYSTLDSLTRYIDLMNMLYPVILVLIFGIGFFVSHLLLKGRVNEIAVFRAIGASKLTVFFSFFSEQLLLSLSGIGIGLILTVAVFSTTINPLNVLLLLLCYYAGLSIAIIHTYSKAVINTIMVKEE